MAASLLSATLDVGFDRHVLNLVRQKLHESGFGL